MYQKLGQYLHKIWAGLNSAAGIIGIVVTVCLANWQMRENSESARAALQGLQTIITNLQGATETLQGLPDALGILTNSMNQTASGIQVFNSQLSHLNTNMVDNLQQITQLQHQSLSTQIAFFAVQRDVWGRQLSAQLRHNELTEKANAQAAEVVVQEIERPYRRDISLLNNFESELRTNLSLVRSLREAIYSADAYKGIETTTWVRIKEHEWSVDIRRQLEPAYAVSSALFDIRAEGGTKGTSAIADAKLACALKTALSTGDAWEEVFSKARAVVAAECELRTRDIRLGKTETRPAKESSAR